MLLRLVFFVRSYVALFYFFFFFFNDTATTEIYTLSLHDALPISRPVFGGHRRVDRLERAKLGRRARSFVARDRKSTRLNSSHSSISYAVFCLKKKKKNKTRNLKIKKKKNKVKH